jgi:hypothetical protein
MASSADIRPRAWSVSQWLALITALTFIAVGVAGFFVTGFDEFAAHDTGERLLIFEVNPLHNIVHLALGLVGLVLFRRVRGALAYGVVVAVAYGGAFVYGLFAVGQEWDILSLNTEDNWLHAGLAALGVLISVVAAYELSPATERRGAVRGTGPVGTV